MDTHSSTAGRVARQRAPRCEGKTENKGERERRTLVVRPGVALAPLDELLVDPSEQARGRVRERVPDRLRARRLLARVACAVDDEPRGCGGPLALLGGVRHEVVREVERGRGGGRELLRTVNEENGD